MTILDNQGFLAREYAQNLLPIPAFLVGTPNYYHRDVIALAELASQKKARILAVTDFDFSPLAKMANPCIFLPGTGDNFCFVAPMFVIAHVIVNEVAYARGPSRGGTDRPRC